MTAPAAKPNRLRRATTAGALAVAVIGGFEGLRLAAYRDVVGVPTVCYGETRGVKMGDRHTKAECDEMLLAALRAFEAGVVRCAPVPMSDRTLVAHVSLAYNIGVAGYCGSSVARLANAGHPEASCDAFMKWNRAGGVVWPGLTRRRAAERDMCLAGLK